MTIKQLKERKGCQPLIVINTPDINTAIACSLSGVDNIVFGQNRPVEYILKTLSDIRRAVPEILITGVLPMESSLISDETAIRDAVRLIEAGADLIYTTGMRPDRIKRLTYQHIPCVSHIGMIPYFKNWIGGFRAVGKQATEAQQLLRTAEELDDAGVICVELECIPHQIASYITKHVSYITLSMGSGTECDGQYLFSCDLLGTHNGHYPRHSISYDNFFEKSINIFKQFKQDVYSGVYPQQKHIIDMDKVEYDNFLKMLGDINKA